MGFKSIRMGEPSRWWMCDSSNPGYRHRWSLPAQVGGNLGTLLGTLRMCGHWPPRVGYGPNGSSTRLSCLMQGVGIPPELHERLAIAAQAEGKSINALAQEALAQRVTA